ncbi:MAG: hypothetical protein ACTSYF_00015 [Promethearchaeota archaeon]
MTLINLLQLFSIKDLALLIRCLFDRIPIIIGGKDADLIDDTLIELTNIMPIRKELIFGTDFLTSDEYNLILKEESLDYDNQRIIFRCPVHSEDQVLSNIKDIKGWVIGLVENGDRDMFFEKASLLRKKSNKSLFLIISKEHEIEYMKYYDNNKKKIDISFENKLINNILSQTEYSIERIKRVLEKKIVTNNLNSSIVESLIDLSQEEITIKENILKKEILEFHHACRRGLALLSRLNFLNQFQSVKIGKKTFFDSISYNGISTERFLDFIQAEWNESFNGLIDNRLVAILGDHLDSLWG